MLMGVVRGSNLRRPPLPMLPLLLMLVMAAFAARSECGGDVVDLGSCAPNPSGGDGEATGTATASALRTFPPEEPAISVLDPALCDAAGGVGSGGPDVFGQCVPPAARCRGVVIDGAIASNDEANAIVRIMNAVLAQYGHGGGAGAVSLVDLNTGVVSRGEQFVSLIKSVQSTLATIRDEWEAGGRTPGAVTTTLPLTRADLDLYRDVIVRIHEQVSMAAFCDPYPCASTRAAELAKQRGVETLFVAKPSFFSRITGNATRPARTTNDEYWHSHVDRDQYGTFAITTLLYLSTHTTPDNAAGVATAEAGERGGLAQEGSSATWPDARGAAFTGGRFVFVDPAAAQRSDGSSAGRRVVEPRLGRLSLFTSGEEHPHRVEQVQAGVRYALTTAFTCSKDDGFALFTSADAGKPPSALPKTSFLHDLRRLLALKERFFS